jgi:protein-histidine pros-kinase
MQNIYGSAQHILKLANDLLELAQDDVGRRTFFAEEFSPLAVLEEVSALMAPQAESKGITFSVQGEPRLPPMRGDVHQFRQILLNLVSNALKFTADRGEVTVAAHLRDPGTLAVSVRDSGIGIRPEDRQRIFDPFGRGQNAVASRIPGVGLGLTLAKRLVELQGGEISVESDGENRGSTFTITLPVTPGGIGPGTPTPPRSGSQAPAS